MNAWTRRIAVIAAVVAVGSLISMAPASAANTPITITPESVAQGGTFTVSGPADCITGSELGISVTKGLTDLAAPQSVSGNAAWQVTFAVPADAELGAYTVDVTNEECTFANGTVTVIAAVVTTTTAAPTTTMATTTTAAPAKAATATPAFTG